MEGALLLRPRRRAKWAARTPREVLAVAIVLFAAVFASSALGAKGEGKAAKIGRQQQMAFFDSRETTASKKVLKGRVAKLAVEPSAAVSKLRGDLGVESVVGLDPLTSTPRIVARLDGFLTGPSGAQPASIGLAYVRRNAEAFGLSSGIIDNLRLARDYVSIDGTHHLYWVQSVNGVPVFGNGLRANVTRDGRLINVLGSPVASLAVGSTSPGISAAQALVAARGDVQATIVPAALRTRSDARQTTSASNGDRAQLVLFQTVSGLRLGWQTLTIDAGFQHVIDAQSGAVLLRRSIVSDITSPAR
jgi:extracellular elastinolytic metalloproteinase